MKSKAFFPNFLGIGAARCATTWLWRNLKEHPQIWMTPKKELHYFDRSKKYPTPNLLTDQPWSKKLFYDKAWRDTLFGQLGEDLRLRSFENLKWDLKYFFSQASDPWYASLFKNAGNRVGGEYTPGYALLDLEDIKDLHKLIPSLKVIYVIRNPLQRAWSSAHMFKNLAGTADVNNDKSLIEAFERDATRRGDYMETLDKWTSIFPQEQFYLGFYEDIEKDASAFLKNICAFLAIDTGFNFSHLHEKILPAKEKPPEIPRYLKKHLAKIYVPQVRELAAKVGSHANEWLSEFEVILNS